MTDTAISTTRIVDARGSFCPGPLMELIRAIREGQVGDVIAVYSSDKGSKTDIPKWVEKAGHRLARSRPAMASTRSSSRSSGRHAMQRILIRWAAASGGP